MKSRAIISAVLLIAFCGSNPAGAQAVFGNVLSSGGPTLGGPQVDSKGGSTEARPYGADSKPLPGLRIPAAGRIYGKWLNREIRNNVELDGVRVPQRVITTTLELKSDSSYTLDYQVYWGAARSGDPEAQYAGLIVKEKGSFAVSGSILLLEADPAEVIQQGKFTRKQQTLASEKRAFIGRLDGSRLNIAGPCAPYQIEAVCERNRTVWFSLLKTDQSRVPTRR